MAIHHKTLGFGAATLLMALTAPAYGQTDQNSGSSEPIENVAALSGGAINAPERTASDDLKTEAIAFQLSTENGEVFAGFGYDLTVQHDSSQDLKASSVSVLSVKARVPVNSTDDNATVDFKSFGNDGTLGISFNHYSTSFKFEENGIADYNVFARQCAVQAGNDWIKGLKQADKAGGHGQVTSFLSQFDTLAGRGFPSIAIFDLMTTDQVVESISIRTNDFAKVAKSVCGLNGSAGITSETSYARRFGAAALGEKEYRRWRRENLDPQTTWFVGFELNAGFNRFSVIDRPSLTLIRTDRVGFDLEGHAGMVLGDGRWVFMVGGGYTRSYKAQVVKQVCGVTGPLNQDTCVEGQDGLPTRTDTGYVTISARKVLFHNKEGDPTLGIRPSVTYIVADHDWQVELPIYFQRSKAFGLDAGVRVIYNSGTDKASFGAFVGKTF